MKKFVVGLFLSLVVLFTAFFIVNADEIKVALNGNTIAFDQPPVMINDRTMVPLRAIFEALEANVIWNEEEQSVIASNGRTTVKVTIDSKTMTKNWQVIELDVPAKLIGGRTLVPLRAVSESFGVTVYWDSERNTIWLSNEKMIFNDSLLTLLDLRMSDLESRLGSGEEFWDSGPLWYYDSYGISVAYSHLNDNLKRTSYSKSYRLHVVLEDVFYNLPKKISTYDLEAYFGNRDQGWNDLYDTYYATYYYKDVAITVWCDKNGNVNMHSGEIALTKEIKKMLNDSLEE